MNMVIFGNFLSEIIGISGIIKGFPRRDNFDMYAFSFNVYTKSNSISFQSRVYQHPERHTSAATVQQEQDALTYQLEYCDYFIKIYDHFWEQDESRSIDDRDKELRTIFRLQARLKDRKNKLDQIVLNAGGGQDDTKDQVYN